MERMSMKALVIFPPLKKKKNKTDTRHSYKEKLYLVENDTTEKKNPENIVRLIHYIAQQRKTHRVVPVFSAFTIFFFGKPQTKKTATASRTRCIPAFAHPYTEVKITTQIDRSFLRFQHFQNFLTFPTFRNLLCSFV